MQKTEKLRPDPTAPLPQPRHESLARMVLTWAERTPMATAICQNGRNWTYAELAITASALARSLPAGEVVAVTGRRSFGLVSSMLAVLSSQSVLLPIDPNLPERRQRTLVEQAGGRHLLVAGEMPAWMLSYSWDEVIKVDPDRAAVGTISALTEPSPDDASYIFFTSGTTGVPKGVRGCHKGLSHFLTWQRNTFCIGSNDRVAQLTNLSFDVSLRDVFLALVSGGTLCLPPDSVNLTAESVLPWMQREAITLLHTVPSLAQTWLGDVPSGVTLPTLRHVFFAGEPLHDSLVRRWRAKFPSAEVANLYGPTETTLAKFFYIVPIKPDAGVQPVGWALPQTEALLLDNDEIAIRTPFRTLGFLNAPDEQRQRFIPNPHRNDPTDLIYRTGDRGRFRADGALEILGRLDHQVKIQGVRVEPDEICAVITKHPSVKAAVVVVRDGPMLVAYLVALGITAAAMREFLGQHLPPAMIPSAFVFLGKLPLNPNGKVDRTALPPPTMSQPFVAPRTQIEQTLEDIWRQVLSTDKVGMEDNFFELGGTSLRLAQVQGKIRKSLNREVPMTTLFRQPTIRTLAAHLSQQTSQPSPAVNASRRAARQIAARTEQVVEESRD